MQSDKPMQSVHQSVLLHEVVANLSTTKIVEEGQGAEGQSRIPRYLDGTLGGAGHMLAMAKAFKGKIELIGLDRDPEAIKRAQSTLEGKAQSLILECADFRNLDKILEKHKIPKVDMILLDLGISSDELDNSGRGFSFLRDEPLFMTFGDPATYAFRAVDIVNDWEEGDIANVIFGYGEERYARRIAKAIVNYRTKKSIQTSGELCEIVKSAVPAPYRHKKTHPATKTFQALRIAVNDEWKALEQGLDKGYESLSEGGRMAVISFHSIEDRIVKNFNKNKEAIGAKILYKKPIIPTDQEIAENPRSRSAKLRILEKHQAELE